MDFVNSIIDRLKSVKKISDSSVNVYVGNLKKINDGKPFGNFDFLQDVDAVLGKLTGKAESTKKNYLVSIVSILSLFPDVPELKALHDKYYGLMLHKKAEIDLKDVNDMSPKETKNWINWDDIKEKFKELETEVNSFYKKKSITEEQYTKLLAYVLLSLYVLVPPRRNKDYQLMYVVEKYTPDLDKEHNYYSINNKRMVFNVYKTAKKYGVFDTTVPKDLQTAIAKYLKHRDTILPVDDQDNKPLLLKYDGNGLSRSSDVTKLLNKIFGKKVGSSMIRHIYLTDKYGGVFDDSVKDAASMAHSVNEQRNYVKRKPVVQL
jgi:hypothetical protein